jgi:hypothetical protein
MRHQMITPIDVPEHRPPSVKDCRKIREWCDRKESEAAGHWTAMERMIRSSVANAVARRNLSRPRISAAPTTRTP